MKQISLVAIDGLGTETAKYESLIKNILTKFHFLPFIEVLFFTSNHSFFNKNFKIIKLEHSLNYEELNKLMLQDVGSFSECDFFMNIQIDGYPLNPNMWNTNFLNYDYIGAPWPKGMRWTGNEVVVGNGGFSIKSKKLYELTKKIIGYENFFRLTKTNEDVFISTVIKNFLIENGIKFAPVEIARQFSVEIPLDETHNINTSFGFHGRSHLENLIKEKDERIM